MKANILSTSGAKKRKVVVVKSDDYYSLSPIQPRKKPETVQTRPQFVYSPPTPAPIYLQSNAKSTPCTSRSYNNLSENYQNYTRNEGSANTCDVNFSRDPKIKPKSRSKNNYKLNGSGIGDLKQKKSKENKEVQKGKTPRKSNNAATKWMTLKEMLPKSSYVNNFTSTATTSSDSSSCPPKLDAFNEGDDNLEQAAVLDLINKRYGNDLEKDISDFQTTSPNGMDPVISYTDHVHTFLNGLESSSGHNFYFSTNLTEYRQYEEQLFEQMNKEVGNIPPITNKLLHSPDNRYDLLSHKELLRLPDKIFASPAQNLAKTENMCPNKIIELLDDSSCDTTGNGNTYEDLSAKIVSLVPEEAFKLKKEVIDFTENTLEFEKQNTVLDIGNYSYKPNKISRADTIKENINELDKEAPDLDICDKRPENILVISPKPEATNAAPKIWEIVPDIFDQLDTDSPITIHPIEDVNCRDHPDNIKIAEVETIMDVNSSDVNSEAQNQNHENGMQLLKVHNYDDAQANVCEQISETEKIVDSNEVNLNTTKENIVMYVIETDNNEAVNDHLVKINKNDLLDAQKPLMDFNENVLQCTNALDNNPESSVINNCEICPVVNMCLADNAQIISGESQNNQPLYENPAILYTEGIYCQPITVDNTKENAADVLKLYSNSEDRSGSNATTILNAAPVNADVNILENSTLMTDSEIQDLRTRIMEGKVNKDEILQIIENKNIIQCNIIVEQKVENSKLEQQKSEAQHSIECLNRKIDVMKCTFKYIEDIIAVAVKSLDGTITEKEMQNIFDNLNFAKVIVDKTFLYYDFSKRKEKTIKYKVINITKKDPPRVGRNNNKNKVAGKVKKMSKQVFNFNKFILKSMYRMNRVFYNIRRQRKLGCNRKQNSMVSKLREIAKKNLNANGRPVLESQSKKRKDTALTELAESSSDANINESSPIELVPRRQVLGSIENTAYANTDDKKEIATDGQGMLDMCEESIDDKMDTGLNKFTEETTTVDCSSLNATSINDENEDPGHSSFQTLIKEEDTTSNLEFENVSDIIKSTEIKTEIGTNNSKENSGKCSRIRKKPNSPNVRHSPYLLRSRKPLNFYLETGDVNSELISTNKEPKRVVVGNLNVTQTDKYNNIGNEIKDDGKACVVLYDKIGKIEMSALENICSIYKIENEENVIICDSKTKEELKKGKTNKRLPDPNLPRMTLRSRTKKSLKTA